MHLLIKIKKQQQILCLIITPLSSSNPAYKPKYDIIIIIKNIPS